MKRFNFKLEKLLMIKEYHEMEARLRYAGELQKKIIVENENREMEKSIINTILSDYISTKEGDRIDPADLDLQDGYVNNLISRIKMNESKKAEIEKKLAELRVSLIEASKEKQKYEKIKESDYKQYKEECKDAEIEDLDDIAGQILTRKKVSLSL